MTKLSYGQLTGVDEKLIGNTGVIHIMDGAGKERSEDLEIAEHGLHGHTHTHKERNPFQTINRDSSFHLSVSAHLPRAQAWKVAHEWTGRRRRRGCCCGTPHLRGSDPPKSS